MSHALSILRTRPGFRRLWIANLTSQLGDWVGWVAVSVYSIHEGDGLLPLAALFAAHHLPIALVSPWAGSFVDRHDRKRVLVVAALAMAALTALMAVCMVLQFSAALPLVLALRSGASAFFSTAERAALPRLVERDELLVAGALESGTWSVVFCLGMALGGFLSALGTTLALSLDALSFLLSASFLLRLPAIPPLPMANDSNDPKAARRAGIRAAWTHVRQQPELLTATLAKTPHAIAGGASWMALHGLVALHFDGAAVALTLGFAHTLRGLGTGLGPVSAVSLIRRGVHRRRVWVVFHGLALAAMALFFLVPTGYALVVLSVLWGAGSGTNWLFSSEGMQRLASDEFQGRVAALDGTFYITAQALAVIACAAVIDAGAPLSATLFFVTLGGVLSLVVFRQRPAIDEPPTAARELCAKFP
ncbi:MAG: MFS family permease [Polyangiales bacterium]|jgi:MFS family permease